MKQRTTHLCHHSPETSQGVTTARCPSGPVDFIVIEERECIGAIRHQDSLEGVHLQDGKAWPHDSRSPGAPVPAAALPTPKQHRAALTLCLLSEFGLASSGERKAHGTMHLKEKLGVT